MNIKELFEHWYVLYFQLNLFLCVGVHGVQKGVRVPEAGLIGGCELPCAFWELNPGLLQDQ